LKTQFKFGEYNLLKLFDVFVDDVFGDEKEKCHRRAVIMKKNIEALTLKYI